MARWGEQRERMAEDVAVLAEDDSGAPGDEDALLALCDNATFVADGVEGSVAADCVGADLTGEALDEAVEKDLARWVQVLGQDRALVLARQDGCVEVYANHLVAGGLYMRGRRKNGTEVLGVVCSGAWRERIGTVTLGVAIRAGDDLIGATGAGSARC